MTVTYRDWRGEKQLKSMAASEEFSLLVFFFWHRSYFLISDKAFLAKNTNFNWATKITWYAYNGKAGVRSRQKAWLAGFNGSLRKNVKALTGTSYRTAEPSICLVRYGEGRKWAQHMSLANENEMLPLKTKRRAKEMLWCGGRADRHSNLPPITQ